MLTSLFLLEFKLEFMRGIAILVRVYVTTKTLSHPKLKYKLDAESRELRDLESRGPDVAS